LHKENLRNSFLGSVLGQTVLHSKILDTSLNPIKKFVSLRNVINRRGIGDLMKKISFFLGDLMKGENQPQITNNITKRSLPRLEAFVGDLALHYHQLLNAIPGAERNTQLDVVCETKDELVNIEVQVEPQNFWDIRILSHVCGLFQRQFPRSFRWSELDDSKPWAKGELRRHFQLTDQNNKKLKMSGIAFLDFNLQAVTSENPSLLQQPTDLQEWLDFLAKAHHKQPEDIESLKTTEVKEAYRMAEIDSWDEKLKAEYREQQAKRYNISHYVKGEKKQAMEKGRKRGRKEGRKEGMEEGRKEGKEEGSKETTEKTALMMIDMGLKDEAVLKATFLSPEQLEEIKRNNNK
jgi:predicted transposase/invertase (TIGR01784 family)